MPEIPYVVEVSDDSGHSWQGTFVHQAPAAVFAGDARATLQFLRSVVNQHAREVLQQAEFECVICKSRARKCVNQPKLYLQTHLPHVYDAACPICDRPSCETRAHQRQNANASAFADREIPGLCAQCGSSGPLQKCSKCLVASYCSKDCQVSHWPQHKRGCRRPAVATA